MKARALAGALLLFSSVAHAGFGKHPIATSEATHPIGPTDGSLSTAPRFSMAAANTTLLANFTFDVGAHCSGQGWTVVDGTAQAGTFWHVDDFAGANVNPGDSLAVLAGSKSLWCGLRASSNSLGCAYAALPGYGNNWNQLWQTKTCLPVTGPLDVSFLLELDSEPSYDYLMLEYKPGCSDDLRQWVLLDGGHNVWDGKQGPFLAGGSYTVSDDTVRVRLRFASDGGWSDEDDMFDSHAGPVVVDNLIVEGLPLENFEGESLGATESNHWEALEYPGYGASYMALFRGSDLVQQDVCARNLSCMWAAIKGSTNTYACGGFPQQAAVPMGNYDGQYLNAEIWSPAIPLVGSGSRVNLQFSVYRDNGLDGLVFYTWALRSIDANGCAGPWRDRGFVYFGGQKDWLVSTYPAGDLIEASATHIQVRLSVVDWCGMWCIGLGHCHSHAPLLDDVRVCRVDIVGPVWSTRDFDLFQDTFPSDGSDTGIGRADAALSLTPSASPTILPGDSARIIVSDPVTKTTGIPSGLADDPTLGGKQVYIWVHVLDSGVPSAIKSGAILTDNPNYRYKNKQTVSGKTWTRIQCWLRVPSTNTFVVDLNDQLFEAGDVVEYFFGATNTNGQTSYCSGPSLTFVQSDIAVAADIAAEFTILPLNGGSSTNILYVDGMDGRGGQSHWDTAFEHLGLVPDRYDVRGPTSSVSNRPGTRVTNVAAQLNANYKHILWDSGDIPQNLGDGTGAPEKSNDYAMVNTFLNGLTTPGGIYICGDDYPAGLNSAAGASAVTFRTTYMPFTLNGGDHRPTQGVSPIGVGVTGGAFSGDTFVIGGGCPLINDFDMMTPSGTSLKQVAYNAEANHAAVVSKTTGNARVMISGFSFVYIRDDEEDGVMDRADHLHDILTFLGGSPAPPTDTDPIAFANSLAQNYPNPFNPQTTIAFSLKARSRVRIDVFDVTGAHVQTLLDETRAAGAYSDVRWDGRHGEGGTAASGVYFFKLVTDGFSQTKKMVLLK